MWKDYSCRYEVSDEGEVRNKKTGKVLKPVKHNHGYGQYFLYFGDKENRVMEKFYAHRIVAEVFIPNTENKPLINHIDGNKMNNNISNLEWCTHSENNTHAYETGLSKEKGQVRVEQYDLDGNLICIHESMSSAGRLLGISNTGIGNCCKGKNDTCGGFRWKYADKEGIEYIPKKRKKHEVTKGRRINQIDSSGKIVKTHEKIVDAATYVGGSKDCIGKCCSGKNKTHKGFIWEYA